MLLAVTRQYKVSANWDAASLLADGPVSPRAGCRALPGWSWPGDRGPCSAAPAAMVSSKHQGLTPRHVVFTDGPLSARVPTAAHAWTAEGDLEP